jgi:uncharacterized MAPEG superfamily protein
MPSLTTLPAFRPLALFAVLLLVKVFAVGFVTANNRRKSQVVVNPEDTGVNPGSHAEPQEAPETLRAKRAHLNDLENIPGFLIIATLYTLAGGPGTQAWAYFGAYFVIRVLHTVCYLKGLQPWRSAAFGLGILTTFLVMGHLLLLTFA